MYQPRFIFLYFLTNGNATEENNDPFDGIIELDVEESTLRKLIDVSDTVKDIGVEINRNSLTLTDHEHSPYRVYFLLLQLLLSFRF